MNNDFNAAMKTGLFKVQQPGKETQRKSEWQWKRNEKGPTRIFHTMDLEKSVFAGRFVKLRAPGCMETAQTCFQNPRDVPIEQGSVLQDEHCHKSHHLIHEERTNSEMRGILYNCFNERVDHHDSQKRLSTFYVRDL